MYLLFRLIIFVFLRVLQLDLISATYQCGMRKHGFVPLVHHGWKLEDGAWPWHVGVFHKQPRDTLRYECGGSLLNERYVLTAAHCAVKRKTARQLPTSIFELHLGQHNLSQVTDQVQIRDVSKVHVHPEYSTLKNDMALLVMRLAVVYTDYVIPICIDQRSDLDLRDIGGHRGWITGWGITEKGNISDVLYSAPLLVVSFQTCVRSDPILFGQLVDENMFCAGDRNGTSPGGGDSGGGMYFHDGDRWVLRGVVSFAKINPSTKEVDTSKYSVFTNVRRYLSWIHDAMTEDEPQAVRGPKRISERECDRFQKLTARRKTGECANMRNPHSILISYTGNPDLLKCNGALISENYAITTCLCTRFSTPAQVQIDGYGSVDILDFECHPEFVVSPKIHDLAIVKLEKPVRLSSHVIPACLANNWTENLYDTLVQTGVGMNKTTGAKQIFESDENEFITEQRCKTIFGLQDDPVTRPGDICVINTDPLRIGLRGVLGSPLQSVNRRTCMSTVVGLLDFTIVSPKWPKDNPWIDGYVRISYYLDWIEGIVWGKEVSEIPIIASSRSVPLYSNSTLVFKMNFLHRLIIFAVYQLLQVDPFALAYHCGTRKHGFVQLVSHGWKAEEGEWPWHVAIFHKQPREKLRYQCGGSLLNEKHLLTAAHCVVNRKNRRPMPVAIFELHLGQQSLSVVGDPVQIRDVSKVHVHPEYSALRNDVALLVMRLAVVFTDYVIPICIDQRVAQDLSNLEGQRGWITGWGTTETGNVSEVLNTASLSVVSYRKCTENDPVLFGNLVNENVFCAGDLNGTSPGGGDSGGGMYFYDGDRWILRGVVSFAKIDPSTKVIDTSKYSVFSNVQRYLTWIKEVMAENEPQAAQRPKRISEKECDRFQKMAAKRKTGECVNSRHPHSISISYSDGDPKLMKCNGVLVSESFAITICICTRFATPDQIQIDGYGSVDILEVTCYPEFVMSPKNHDLAVVKLKTPVQLSSSVIPACLASNWTENLYDTLVQTGVGMNATTGVQQIFESEDNEFITEERCKKIFGLENDPVTRPGDMCVINTDPLRIGLHGIMGAPLQSVNRQACLSTIVGLKDFVIMYDTWPKDLPWVEGYVRISYYLDWLEQIIWNEELQPRGLTATENLLVEQNTETSSTTPIEGIFNKDFVFPDQLENWILRFNKTV
ncbi:uncharacterized protein LOC134206267 [Armigeres subalbatus]|uniref:uncharacterized protein LOC134206267 n=1 Tax=Armigeres subalbatus TaxID=124917 RepID=UPI002ED63AAE